MDQIRHPIIVKAERGGFLESHHFVEAIVFAGSPDEATAFGNVDRPVFPRSTLKWIQALPLVGLHEQGKLSAAELALACASHRGEAEHVRIARAWRERLKLSDADLVCGFHPPADEGMAEEFIRAGTAKTKLYSNCVGKHLGFCHWSLENGHSPKKYWHDEHPAQELFKTNLRKLGGLSGALTYGIDGCGVPNYRMTLRELATAYFRWLERPESEVVLRAMTAHPNLIAGTTSLDTWMISATGGRVFMKTGAEGMYVALIPEEKTVIALKAADGNARASRSTVLSFLSQWSPGGADFTREARAKSETPILNWAGERTGQILVEGVTLS